VVCDGLSSADDRPSQLTVDTPFAVGLLGEVRIQVRLDRPPDCSSASGSKVVDRRVLVEALPCANVSARSVVSHNVEAAILSLIRGRRRRHEDSLDALAVQFVIKPFRRVPLQDQAADKHFIWPSQGQTVRPPSPDRLLSLLRFGLGVKSAGANLERTASSHVWFS